jgi:hypothetical protein
MEATELRLSIIETNARLTEALHYLDERRQQLEKSVRDVQRELDFTRSVTEKLTRRTHSVGGDASSSSSSSSSSSFSFDEDRQLKRFLFEELLPRYFAQQAPEPHERFESVLNRLLDSDRGQYVSCEHVWPAHVEMLSRASIVQLHPDPCQALFRLL